MDPRSLGHATTLDVFAAASFLPMAVRNIVGTNKDISVKATELEIAAARVDFPTFQLPWVSTPSYSGYSKYSLPGEQAGNGAARPH